MTPPTSLSAADLARIAERAENATEAPWSQIESPWGDGKSVTQGPGDPHGHLLICRTDENEWQEDIHHGEENWFNAAFIASARSDVPALLAHIATLQITVQNLEGQESALHAEKAALADRLAEATTIGEKNIQRADAYWVELNDLRAQLAEAERDANASAEVVDQLIEAHRERQDLLTAMTQKVMEQSGQLATAPDPATVAAMRELLREIIGTFRGDWGPVGVSGETYLSWKARADALLGPTTKGG